MPFHITKTVKGVKRIQNSVNGNARYELTFDDSTHYRTKPDAAFALEIDHDGQRLVGERVELQISRRDQILDIRVLDAVVTR